MPIRTVLLIDDEADVRRVAELTLRAIGGWTVLSAATGDEGIAIAKRDAPDVILLDAMMPTMDGPATLDRLRADPATAGIPVLFLTAKTRKQDVDALKARGAAGVLAKPFDPMTLPAEILRALGIE